MELIFEKNILTKIRVIWNVKICGKNNKIKTREKYQEPNMRSLYFQFWPGVFNLVVCLVWSSGCVYFWKELLVTVFDVSTIWAIVIFRVKVILYRQWIWLLTWLYYIPGQKPETNTIHWRYNITLTLKMTTAQIVETSVTVTNSSFQNYTNPDDPAH